MKIKTKELLKAVEPLLVVAQSRTMLPITRCLRMEVVLGELKILTTNTTEYSERVLGCDEQDDISPFCVDASKFIAVLSRETKEEVEVEIAGGWMTYKGAASAKFATLAATEFPGIPDQKLESVGLNCEDLADHVESVEWVAQMSTKERLSERQFYGTINIFTTTKSMAAMAACGTVGAVRESAAICSNSNFSVPREYVGAFCRALRSEESDLLVGENYISVTFKGGRWFGRMVQDAFPTEPFLSTVRGEFLEVGSVPVKELLPHLEIANQFINPQKWTAAIIRFEDKSATLKFSYSDSDYEYEITGKFSQNEWKIDPRQVYLALRHFKPESLFRIKCDDAKHLISDGVLDVIIANIR